MTSEDKDLAKRVAIHLLLAIVTVASLGVLGWIAFDSLIMPKVARTGWEVVVVPDVTGLDANAASEKLAEAGLEPEIDMERKSAGHLGPDQVAMQRPAANDSVKRGHIVRVWLSAGATTVPVPDLVGQDSSAAATHVQEAGLEIASIEWTASGKFPAGTVIRSEPAAGRLLARGTSIKLVISTGPDADSLAADSGKSTPKVF